MLSLFGGMFGGGVDGGVVLEKGEDLSGVVVYYGLIVSVCCYCVHGLLLLPPPPPPPPPPPSSSSSSSAAAAAKRGGTGTVRVREKAYEGGRHLFLLLVLLVCAYGCCVVFSERAGGAVEGAVFDALEAALRVCVVFVLFCVLFRGLIFQLQVNYQLRHVYSPPFKFPSGHGDVMSSPVKLFKFKRKLCKERNNTPYLLWFSFLPIVVLTDPNDIRDVIQHNTSKSMLVYGLFTKWLGKFSLIISGGADWRQMRTLLDPVFHHRLIENYAKVMESAVDELVLKLDELCDCGEDFDVQPHAAALTLDIVCRCAFSYESGCQKEGKEKNDAFISTMNRLTSAIFDRFCRPYLLVNWIYALTSASRQFNKDLAYVHGHADAIIKKRREELKSLTIEDIKRDSSATGRALLDFLDVLLLARDENGRGLSNKQIRDQCNTFLFAGHDTTATTLSFFLYAMSQHPDIQQKCYDEIVDVFGSEGSVDIQDLPKLRYTTMCIKETLRMYGPVANIVRQTNDFIPLSSGITLPPNATVDLCIYGVHHNGNVWKDPFVFDPERFSDAKKVPKYGFMPFSVGERICIGNNFATVEEQVMITHLLRRYVFKPAKEATLTLFDEVVLRSVEGINIRVERRKADV